MAVPRCNHSDRAENSITHTEPESKLLFPICVDAEPYFRGTETSVTFIDFIASIVHLSKPLSFSDGTFRDWDAVLIDEGRLNYDNSNMRLR